MPCQLTDAATPTLKISLLATVMASRTRSATGPVSRSSRARSIAMATSAALPPRLPANPIDDHEETAVGVDMEAVLVDLPLQTWIGVAGRSLADGPDGHAQFLTRSVIPDVTGHQPNERGEQHEPRTTEERPSALHLEFQKDGVGEADAGAIG